MKKLIFSIVAVLTMTTSAMAQSIDIPVTLDDQNYTNLSAMIAQSIKDAGFEDILGDLTPVQTADGKQVLIPAPILAAKQQMAQTAASSISECESNEDKGGCVAKAIAVEKVAVAKLNTKEASMIKQFSTSLMGVNAAYLANAIKENLLVNTSYYASGTNVILPSLKITREGVARKLVFNAAISDETTGLKDLVQVTMVINATAAYHSAGSYMTLDYSELGKYLGAGNDATLFTSIGAIQMQFESIEVK